ncbi:acyltransferase family protein [Roseateles sp. LYH14W]|uniref:Acyltransferase family protein n=1 Tax=Pelomonas parva TaxID=3299032 RepID=A0ABW7F667_9BURK
MGSASSGRLEVLQALRAIAAALVVLLHSFYTYAEKVSPVDPISGVGLHYDLAAFGVKLFFCISGFIIYKSTASLDPGWDSASFFARRRLIRIVPLYWAVTLIYAAKLAMGGDSPTLMDVARSLFFIPFADASGQIRPVLGAGWTLNFEMLFYAVLCASLGLTQKWRFVVVGGAFAALLTARLFDVAPQNYQPGDTAWGLMADSVLLFFLAGMAVASLTQRDNAHGPSAPTFVVGILAMLGILFGFAVPAAVFGLDAIGSPRSIGVTLLEVTVCFALVYVCVKPYVGSGFGAARVVRRSVVAAGDGSYSTYLIHGFVMGPAARVIYELGLNVGPWVFAILMVLLCTVIGVLAYRFFECPMQLRLNEVFGKHKQGESLRSC